VSAIAATTRVVVNIDSIAGLNGSGVHDQSAIPPPTRANIKGKGKKRNEQRRTKQTNKQRKVDTIIAIITAR
jgi:phage terminase large subunit-like protein